MYNGRRNSTTSCENLRKYLNHHVNNKAINTLTELNFGTSKNQSWTFASFFY